MSIPKEPLPAWLDQLLGPKRPELSCDDCFDLLDRYVDLELVGADADTTIPGMDAHLEGCAACREEHELLLAYAGRREP